MKELSTPFRPLHEEIKSFAQGETFLPACFCMGRYLCLEPIFPVAMRCYVLWRHHLQALYAWSLAISAWYWLTSQVSLSLSLSLSLLLLTKVTHAQYTRRFRAWYNHAEKEIMEGIDGAVRTKQRKMHWSQIGIEPGDGLGMGTVCNAPRYPNI